MSGPPGKSLADVRRDYVGEPLSEIESDPNPFAQFDKWFEQARGSETDPTAMFLATATPDGRPSVRTVLLKGYDASGFVFYTNYDSQKAHELDATGRASLLFYWASLSRQVRICGRAERVPDADSDAYFAKRPVESRWSVYASHQSATIQSREALESRYHAARELYGEAVPRPAWWGGYRVIADELEFWQGRPSRLHDRVRYSMANGIWTRDRLAP